MDAFALLTDADLAALATALRSGRLHAPFSEVAVQRYCSAARAPAAAVRLQDLHNEGMRPRHMALIAETILHTRSHLPSPADLVDLVWTGPEARTAANRDTAVVVRDLFASAESDVLVAGFAVYQGREVFKRLAERMDERPDLRVKLFLDVHRHTTDSTCPEELLRRFVHRFKTQDWPWKLLPELFYDPRSIDLDVVKRSSMHAKCIVIDRRTALVTSANFTEAAQTRNIEVGAWFDPSASVPDWRSTLRPLPMRAYLRLLTSPAATGLVDPWDVHHCQTAQEPPARNGTPLQRPMHTAPALPAVSTHRNDHVRDSPPPATRIPALEFGLPRL